MAPPAAGPVRHSSAGRTKSPDRAACGAWVDCAARVDSRERAIGGGVDWLAAAAAAAAATAWCAALGSCLGGWFGPKGWQIVETVRSSLPYPAVPAVTQPAAAAPAASKPAIVVPAAAQPTLAVPSAQPAVAVLFPTAAQSAVAVLYYPAAAQPAVAVSAAA